MAELKAYRKKYTNKLVKPEREEYVLTLKNVGTVSAADIIEEAADHCRLLKSDLDAAFNAITKAMVLYLKIGHGVQLPNIGSLQPTIRAKAVLTEKECTQETLKGTGGVTINMQPIGDFKKAVDGFRIRIVKSATDDTTIDDGEQNQQTPGVTKYTVTYQHKGSTVTTQQYAEGERVVEPAAPEEGWIWGNTPSVMPARDVTVTSVEDE